MQPITVTHFTDPGCPWAYSASPAHATLRWRYGGQLDWRLVLIGLTEHSQQYLDRGYTPLRQARGYRGFRRYGMPFATAPKDHVAATSRACRAIVAAREMSPELGDAAFRALQLAQFNSTLALDVDADLVGALRGIDGLDAEDVVGRIDDDEVVAAYEADRALARTAEGSPTAVQGKAAQTDGPVRYTAPSLIFRRGDAELEAGGFQPVEAYDVLLANLDPALERRPAPEDPLAALEAEPQGLMTAEIAEIMRSGNAPADRGAAEDALIALAAEGTAVRVGLGDDALWIAGRYAAARFARASSIAALNGVTPLVPAS